MAYCLNEENNDEIILSNIDKDKFPQEKISTDPYQKLREPHIWINYFICGYKAVLSVDQKYAAMVEKPKGFKVMIDSVVPAEAGVSSSSAFTVCSAVLALHVNGL